MAEFLEARYPTPRPKLRAQWKKELEEQWARDGGRRGRSAEPAAALLE
jgi:hypothetical protein